MTAAPAVMIDDLRRTLGPTPALGRRAIMARVTATSGADLAQPAARKRLIERLCEALLAGPESDLWAAQLSVPPATPAVFLARLLAATAVHLQNVAGHPVSRCTALEGQDGTAPTAVWEYLLPSTGAAAGRAAAELLTAVAGSGETDAEPFPLQRVQEIVSSVTAAFGNSVVEVLLTAAYRRGIPFRFIDPVFPMIAFGQGSATKRLMTSMTHRQGHISTLLTRDKMVSLKMLREAGFPVPSHRYVSSAKAAVAAAAALGYPVVVKPLDLMRGQGVSVNLTSPKAVTEAFHSAQSLSRNLIVEQYLPGLPYRILVIGGRAAAAMRRSVPMVVGDGASSIAELVERTNHERARMALTSSSAPRRIDITDFEDELHACLAEQGLDWESIPPAGAEVQLAFMARSGRGGENLDVTHLVHPDNLAMAEEAARIFDVDVFGLDFMTDDISRSYKEGNCGINEVNNEPALSLHLASTRSPRDVVTPFFDLEFGPQGKGCIPIVCHLADSQDAPFSELDRVLRAAGLQPGIAVDRDQAATGRFQLPPTPQLQRPAARVLADPRVDCALISLTPEDFNDGLAFDRCTAFVFPPAPNDGQRSPTLTWSRVMTSGVAATAILPERDLSHWTDHLDLSSLRIILISDDGHCEGVAHGNSYEAVRLRSGREISVVLERSGHTDHLISLAQRKDGSGAFAQRLLLACAALLALNWHPRTIGRLVQEALA